MVNLWKIISSAFERLPRKDGQMLSALEPLLAAGFLSRRRAIVNISVLSWNATFGKESSLRYPSRLERALQRMRNTVELSVPSLPTVTDSSVSRFKLQPQFAPNQNGRMIQSHFMNRTQPLNLSRGYGLPASRNHRSELSKPPANPPASQDLLPFLPLQVQIVDDQLPV